GPDGSIVFGESIGVLRRITTMGGAAAPLTTLNLANGENAHRWPQFLPGGRRFLYFVRSGRPYRSGIYMSSLDRPHEAVLVLANETSGMYAAPYGNAEGHLLWVRDGKLVAQAFDPDRARLSGEPTVIAGTEGVGASLNDMRASFSLSQQGTLL